MTSSYHLHFNSPGEVYVVQTRNCLETHRRVFKFGRTRSMANRLRQYPKGSRLIACLPVSHMIDAERMLMSLCHKRFVQRKDFGNEYFEGDVADIVGALVNVVSHFPHAENGDGLGHRLRVVADDMEEARHGLPEASPAPSHEPIIVHPGNKSVSLLGLALQPDHRASLTLMQRERAMDRASSFVQWAEANASLPRRASRRRVGVSEEWVGPEEQTWSRWLESYRAAAKNVGNARIYNRRPFANVVIPYLDLHLGKAYWMGLEHSSTVM